MVSFINQKGGTGKTTCAVNTAAALAAAGNRVLLIDMDYQGDASRSLGWDIFGQEDDRFTSYDLSSPDGRGTEGFEAVPVGESLELVPASTRLAAVNQMIQSDGSLDVREGHLILKYRIGGIKGYDYIVLDGRPAVNDLTALMTVVAADVLVVVFWAGYLDFMSVNWLERIFDGLKKGGVMSKSTPVYSLLNFFDSRQTIDREVRERVEELFGERAFQTAIRKNTDLTWAPGTGVDIFRSAPKSKGAEDFRSLAKEVMGIA